MTIDTAETGAQPRQGSPAEVFRVFLKLGLTSFGGPIAHLGYFRDELVQRRKWIDEAGYADIVALCQFLPGPASSQMARASANTEGTANSPRTMPLTNMRRWRLVIPQGCAAFVPISTETIN